MNRKDTTTAERHRAMPPIVDQATWQEALAMPDYPVDGPMARYGWSTSSTMPAGSNPIASPTSSANRELRTIDGDLGPLTYDQHHLIDGDLVAQHVTVHGAHRASTMPLLADLAVSGQPTAWDLREQILERSP